MKHKHRDISPREQRLIGNFIQDVFHTKHISKPNEDQIQCAWVAFLCAYRDNPSAFSSPHSLGWERAYLMILDALAEAKRQHNFWQYRQASLEQPVSHDVAVPRAQLLTAPHGDFQNSVCFYDYLQHMKQNVRQMAYELINGSSISEIQSHYGLHPNYIRYIYQNLQTEMQEYLTI